MKTQEENQKLKKENDIYKSFICHVKNSFKMINDDISEIDVYRSLRTRANDILNNKAERLIEIGAKCQEDMDKKYTEEDMLKAIEKAIYLKGGFDKEGFSFYKDDNEIKEEVINSLNKQD